MAPGMLGFQADRVTVIFAIDFSESDERAIAKVRIDILFFECNTGNSNHEVKARPLVVVDWGRGKPWLWDVVFARPRLYYLAGRSFAIVCASWLTVTSSQPSVHAGPTTAVNPFLFVCAPHLFFACSMRCYICTYSCVCAYIIVFGVLVVPDGVRGRSASRQQLAAVHLHPRRTAGAQEHAHAAGAATCWLPQFR